MLAVALVSACQSGATGAPSAVLEVLAGSVDVRGPERLSLEAGSDSKLAPGDTVVTGPSSSAVVVFFDGSVAMLASSTTLIIEEIGGSRESGETAIQLFQSAGRSFHKVQKLVDADSSYAVRSPASVGLVRGTVFIVEVDADTGDAAWKTVEGTVRVVGAVGPEVSVVAGTATTIELGGGAEPPAPSSVTDDERPFLDALNDVIEEQDVEPPPDKDPSQTRTPVAGPTPTIPPVGPQSIPPLELTTGIESPSTVSSANRPDRPTPEGRTATGAPAAPEIPSGETASASRPRDTSPDNGEDRAVPRGSSSDGNGPGDRNRGDEDSDRGGEDDDTRRDADDEDRGEDRNREDEDNDPGGGFTGNLAAGDDVKRGDRDDDTRGGSDNGSPGDGDDDRDDGDSGNPGDGDDDREDGDDDAATPDDNVILGDGDHEDHGDGMTTTGEMAATTTARPGMTTTGELAAAATAEMSITSSSGMGITRTARPGMTTTGGMTMKTTGELAATTTVRTGMRTTTGMAMRTTTNQAIPGRTSGPRRGIQVPAGYA